MLVVAALDQPPTQSFALVLFPPSAPGSGASGPSMMRRRWASFVPPLFGADPPVHYDLRSAGGPRPGP